MSWGGFSFKEFKMSIEIYEYMPQHFNYLVVMPSGKQYLFDVKQHADLSNKWLWTSRSGKAERLPKSVCQKMTDIVGAINA